MTGLPESEEAGYLPAGAFLRAGRRWRAPYAADPARSRGRLHPEYDSQFRSAFQRDRDRIIHSNAFRRLKHKTQVFISQAGDHFRTRLTHTLEVAQVARSLALPLGLDEDLAEALALAHDLGHPPFGHAGERAIDAAMAGEGGFDHNAQSLRVVTLLETRYLDFDGLNLTLETLEGLVKHNGPLTDARGQLIKNPAAGLPFAIRDFGQTELLRLARPASLEAQMAAVADDIAYDTHDLEDGMRAGLLTLDELGDVPLAGAVLREIANPAIDEARVIHELVRRLIGLMVGNVIGETAARLRAAGIRNGGDVLEASSPLVGFSPEMAKAEAGLKAFLFDRLYRHPAVTAPAEDAAVVVRDLCAFYAAHPDQMSQGWQARPARQDSIGGARRAADYVAGMTDRLAISEHRRLFDHTPDLG